MWGPGLPGGEVQRLTRAAGHPGQPGGVGAAPVGPPGRTRGSGRTPRPQAREYMGEASGLAPGASWQGHEAPFIGLGVG